MPRRKTRNANGVDSEHDRDETEETREPVTPPSAEERIKVARDAAAEAAMSALAGLSELQPGTKVMVERRFPHYARGYLPDVWVGEGEDADDILGKIRREYGGGTYNLQVKRRGSRGFQFASAATSIEIAGEPLYEGRRYVGGELEPKRKDPDPPAAPAWYPAPPAQSSDNRPYEHLITLVRDVIQRGNPAAQGPDVVGLITALQHSLQPQPTRDTFGDLDRTLALLAKLQRFAAPPEPPALEKESDSGLEKAVMLMLMRQFGGQGPNPEPTPPWAPSSQPPAPGMLWDPVRHAWVGATPPATKQSTEETFSGPEASQHGREGRYEAEEDEDLDEGPFEVQDFMDEMSRKTPEQREAFMAELLAHADTLRGSAPSGDHADPAT